MLEQDGYAKKRSMKRGRRGICGVIQGKGRISKSLHYQFFDLALETLGQAKSLPLKADSINASFLMLCLDTPMALFEQLVYLFTETISRNNRLS